MIGATCVNDDQNDNRNRTRKNWKAEGELSVSCQSANISKGHDQGQTAPYTSSIRITIRNTTSRIEPVSYYCFLFQWWCEMLLWGSLWWCWLAVVIEVPAIVHLIFVPDQYWLLIFSGIFFVSCGVCIGSDFWRPRRVYCSAWVGVPVTPGVPLTKQRGGTQPQPWSDQPSQSWHNVTVLRRKKATHQDIFEGDIVVGELDKFLSRDGGVGSHLGFV